MSEFDDYAPVVTNGPALDALGLVHRVHRPSGEDKSPVLIMIHGHKGNEDVTWIFARAASPEWLIVSPRAPIPHPVEPNSYSWYTFDAETNVPSEESILTALGLLERFIVAAITQYGGDPARVVLLGFSQGAAMAYRYSMAHRETVRGVAALGGFIPHLNEITLPPLNGLPVLILHGTQDEIIPVKMAQRARERLAAAGASVQYEESEVGHKVSAQGMRTLAAWLTARKQG